MRLSLLSLLLSSILAGCGVNDLPIELTVKRDGRPLAMVRKGESLWVATRYSGVFEIQTAGAGSAGSVTEIPLDGSKKRTHWMAAFRESIWLASDAGLIRFSPENNTIAAIWTEEDGLPSSSVRWVGENSGNVWIGTTKGIGRMDSDGKWTIYRKKEGLPTTHAYRGISNKDGFWVSCIAGGLVKWADGTWRAIPQEKGLGNHYIYAMIEGKFGLWLGTAGGVNYYRTADERWDEAVCRDGFTDYCVYSLALIGDELWFATNFGLYRRQLASGRQWVYGRREGLPSDEASALLYEAGKLWVGTSEGVALIDTSKL